MPDQDTAQERDAFGGLGPLPKQTHFPGLADIKYFTADQMRAYAAQEVAAERERCATLIEPKNEPSDWTELAQYASYLAKRIRTES